MTNNSTARQNLERAIARLHEAERAMAESLAWIDITFALIRARSL